MQKFVNKYLSIDEKLNSKIIAMGYWQKNILYWILTQITLDSKPFAKQETPPIVFMFGIN